MAPSGKITDHAMQKKTQQKGKEGGLYELLLRLQEFLIEGFLKHLCCEHHRSLRGIESPTVAKDQPHIGDKIWQGEALVKKRENRKKRDQSKLP